MKRAALLIAFALASPATAKKRPKMDFAPAAPAPVPAPRAADGAIFHTDAGYAALVEGTRARAVGDPLTIALVERITTSKGTSGKTDRDGGFSLTPPSIGPLALFTPQEVNSSGNSSFKGGGSASQTSSLSGEITVTIAEVRPNGTALVRGEKRMLLSQGDEWVQFAGIVRLIDITPDNRLASTRVADAHIEYSGKGSVQRASREGWLQRFFNMVSPF